MKKRKNVKAVKEKTVKKRELIESFLDLEFNETNVYIKCAGYYAAILRISGTDIFHFKDEDKRRLYDRFSKATRSLDLPAKYVFTSLPPNLTRQKDFILYKLERANNNSCRGLLKRQIDKFYQIESRQQDRVCLLVIFAEETQKLDRCSQQFAYQMSEVGVTRLSGENLKAAVRQLLGFSPALSGACLPEKIIFKRDHISLSNKLCTDLVVYSYPAILKDLQFAALISSFGSDVIVTLDCKMQPAELTKDQFDRAISELKGRRALTQTDAEAIESESDILDLQKLYAEISRGNEQMTSVCLRFFITAVSYEKLSERCERVQKELASLGMKAFVPEYCMREEYFSLLHPADKTKNAILLEDTFKRQFPFYYQSLIDERGTYFGETITGGQVIFNPFLQTKERISYDILLSGVKGSGKTITLKSMIADQITLGNKIMLFDIEGEYRTLAEKLGGTVITLGKSSAINPLQLRTSVASGDKDSEETNFISEISRIEMFFKQFAPEITPFELEAFTDSLLDTYAAFGISPNSDLSKIRASDFPQLSDLLQTVQGNLALKGLAQSKRQPLEKVELYLKPLAVGAYSPMFNGSSSFDFKDSNLVVFDVKALSELSERVFNAQLTNILSIMWSEICCNMEINNNLTNPYDRRAVIAVIDEAARYIDSENVMSYMVKLLRRSRKYDAALWFASQAMSDFKIDCSVLFGLVQYKMLLRQSADAKDLIAKVFPQFTPSELISLENLAPGEMLLSLSGSQKLRLQKIVPKEDLLWFGNSRDKERLEGKSYEKQQ